MALMHQVTSFQGCIIFSFGDCDTTSAQALTLASSSCCIVF